MANSRYRIGEDPITQGGYAGDEAFYLFTVVLSLVIGFILVWLSWRGRQIWLFCWSAGLIVAAIAYLTWVVVR